VTSVFVEMENMGMWSGDGPGARVEMAPGSCEFPCNVDSFSNVREPTCDADRDLEVTSGAGALPGEALYDVLELRPRNGEPAPGLADYEPLGELAASILAVDSDDWDDDDDDVYDDEDDDDDDDYFDDDDDLDADDDDFDI
jgi:hypothetical protein